MGLLPLISPINSLVRSERGDSRCHGSLRLDQSIWSYKTEMAADSDEKETKDWRGGRFHLNVTQFSNEENTFSRPGNLNIFRLF